VRAALLISPVRLPRTESLSEHEFCRDKYHLTLHPASLFPSLRQRARAASGVVPDARYPNMWRMIWTDGRVSDIANLTRIKDAAEAACTDGRNPLRLRWERSDSPSGARTRGLRRPDAARQDLSLLEAAI
jgi:hypothetical protein